MKRTRSWLWAAILVAGLSTPTMTEAQDPGGHNDGTHHDHAGESETQECRTMCEKVIKHCDATCKRAAPQSAAHCGKLCAAQKDPCFKRCMGKDEPEVIR
jgi:hypothetical protein